MSAAERLQLMEDLFHEALKRAPAERAAFLAEASPNDPELAAEVSVLLAEHGQTAGPLDDPPHLFISSPSGTSTRARDLSPGSTVNYYRVLKLLGKGGMGEVYLADDTRLGRKVALKLLPASLTDTPDRLRRFAREARALSALNHPNIITIYEVGEAQGLQFIVTELVEGQTLRNRMADSGLGLMDAVDIAVQIASALAAAHESGVVHRDIKPENVMVRPDGIVKVLDFGLAKLTRAPLGEEVTAGSTSSVSLPGIVMGTPAYMSPEQACGQETDARSDLFSFGVLLYEIISGRLPFSGPTVSSLIAAILTSHPDPLAQVAPGCPAALQTVVNRTLAKDPSRRYASAREMLRDLGRVKYRMGAEDERDAIHIPPPELTETADFSVAGEAPANFVTSIVIKSASFREGLVTSGRRLLRFAEPGRPFYAGIAVILLALAGTGLHRFIESRGSIDSLAILPFAGGGTDIEYLSDNLTDGLIDILARTPQLKVISRNSVAQFKGQVVDPVAVGSRLNVRAILTGRINQRGDEVQIEVEVIDTRDRSLIWSHKYRKKSSDIRFAQEEIAWETAMKLRKNTGLEETARTRVHQQHNQAAYELYAQGRWHWNKRTLEGRRQAISSFQKAIDLDPTYALAYAGLADAHVLSGDVPPQEVLLRAKAAVTRALDLDSTLAEGHATLGFIKAHYEMDWVKADEEFEKAIELKPSYATAHHWYADSLLARGQFEEALQGLKRAQELDPLSPVINTDVGLYYFYMRQYEQAANHFRKMSELFPGFFQALVKLGWTYTQMGRYVEAIEQYQKALSLAEGNTQILAMLGHVYAVSGNASEARAILSKLHASSNLRYVSPQRPAIVHIGLGEKDAALEHLYKAREGFDIWLMYIKIDPYWDQLRDDPRFGELLRRMNLMPM